MAGPVELEEGGEGVEGAEAQARAVRAAVGATPTTGIGAALQLAPPWAAKVIDIITCSWVCSWVITAAGRSGTITLNPTLAGGSGWCTVDELRTALVRIA